MSDSCEEADTFPVPTRRTLRPFLVRDTLGRLLRDNRALGLTATAISELVKSADLDDYRPGQTLFTATDESDVLRAYPTRC